MRLSAKPIINYQNINSFNYSTEWIIRREEQNTLYFQLVDLNKDGLRYIPTNASLEVIFPALDSTNTITKTAVNPSTLDTSIWSINILPTDTINSGNVQFILTDNGVVRRFVLLQGIVVEMFNQGGC